MLRIEKSFYVSDNLFLGRSYIFFFYFCLYSSLDHYLHGPLELNSPRPSFLLIPFILTIICSKFFRLSLPLGLWRVLCISISSLFLYFVCLPSLLTYFRYIRPHVLAQLCNYAVSVDSDMPDCLWSSRPLIFSLFFYYEFYELCYSYSGRCIHGF